MTTFHSATNHPTRRIFALNRPWLAAVVAACALMSVDTQAQAQFPGGFGFQPFGFYQPYGIQYRSSVATPPYFSVNPPVYYGTRHSRPYGISPFAAPPQVTAPPNYQGGPMPSGIRQRHYGGPVGNPFICRNDAFDSTQAKLAQTSGDSGSAAVSAKSFTPGEIQVNPFYEQEVRFASR